MPIVATIVEKDDGQLMAAWFTADGEGDPDAIDWDGVIVTGYAVLTKLRRCGIAATALTVTDLEVRVP